MKKRFAAMVMAAALLLGLPMGVRGQERKCTLTVQMTWNGEQLTGGVLKIFLVGSAENGEFVLRPELEDCQPEPEELAQKVTEEAITGKIATVRNGAARFTGLEPGLYLVIQTDACPGYHPINPFLLSLPGEHNGQPVYDLLANPKVAPDPENTEPTLPTVGPDETEPDETEPDETEPDETKPDETEPGATTETTAPPQETKPDENVPKLPQTGQLNWPVPVMVAAGMLLLVLGCWLCFGKKDEYES